MRETFDEFDDNFTSIEIEMCFLVYYQG